MSALSSNTPAPAALHSADGAPTHDHPSEHAHNRRRLGAYLCWAVVFADIGTSVYYTPGILYGTAGVGEHAALFVSMVTAVFVLLALKYAEVTIRYPEGGGVVTVGTRALHPFVGLVGGMFILVDYFLTAALSAVSGIAYLAVVFPTLAGNLTEGMVAIAVLIALGVLNWVGISESAKVSAVFASVAFVSQVVVVITVVAHVGIGHLLETFPKMMSGPHLTGTTVLFGYAGAFLAFSGLESISQLSPVMAQPRRRVARVAMGAVVATIGLTSPLLTLWSTTLLPHSVVAKPENSNALISILAGASAGRWLSWEVAVSGAVLLLFACNTAIIGTYHVFLALSRMRFFPDFIERRNRLRGTPHFAILLAVGIPVLILIPASASADTQVILGDLYAFGLLGAFSVTCVSLDVVRWRELRVLKAWAARAERREQTRQTADNGAAAHEARKLKYEGDHRLSNSRLTRVNFVVGVVTTVLVVLAWSTNLVHKLPATFFGGSVTTVGLIVALVNYSRLNRRGIAIAFPSTVRAALPDAVMVLLPSAGNHIDEMVRAAAAAAGGRPVVFLYQGSQGMTQANPRLFQVVDPYIYDRPAQDAFGRAEKIARRLKLDRRFVYIPADKPNALARIWQTIRPRDMLIQAGQEGELHEIAADRVRRAAGASAPILHYLKNW